MDFQHRNLLFQGGARCQPVCAAGGSPSYRRCLGDCASYDGEVGMDDSGHQKIAQISPKKEPFKIFQTINFQENTFSIVFMGVRCVES